MVCSDKKASMLFKPCGHMCACDGKEQCSSYSSFQCEKNTVKNHQVIFFKNSSTLINQITSVRWLKKSRTGMRSNNGYYSGI